MKNNKKYIIACTLVLLLVVAVFAKPVAKRIYPVTYNDYVEKYCIDYNVEPELAYSVIKCESGFNAKAVSYCDAKGLMQLTDDTFEWMQRMRDVEQPLENTALFNPETNIDYGIYLLSYLTQRYNGDIKLALCAYHAGVGNVGEWLENPLYSADGIKLDVIPFSDTESYVERVTKYMEYYRYLYNF